MRKRSRARIIKRRFSISHDTGSVTAEIAISFMMVVFVSAFLYSGIQLSGKQLRLQEASAVAARQISRGEGVNVKQLVDDVEVSVNYRNGYVCAQLKSTAGGLLSGIEINASSCALDKGH